MEFTNCKQEVFSIGDVMYYNLVEPKALNIITKKARIKSFMVKKDGIYVVTKNGNNIYYVNINDIYHTEKDAKEVVIRWQKEVLRKELQQEITSYLNNQ
jgi:hypothetical protein